MEELEIFKKRVSTYIEKAYTGNVSLLMFLDEAKIGILNHLIKHQSFKIHYYGGFKNSDRLRAILSLYPVSKEDFKIIVYKIIYNKRYYSIHHRNVLGSLMSLGIKRECIGDIIINEEKEVYFACCFEISKYIKDNFHLVGNVPIALEEEREEIENIVKYETKNYFVSSLRLDAIIAASYKLSRSEALEFISNGLVYINHVLILNPSHTVELKDEISVRHKGRVKLSEIGGKSKSGRIAVSLSKRV